MRACQAALVCCDQGVAGGHYQSGPPAGRVAGDSEAQAALVLGGLAIAGPLVLPAPEAAAASLLLHVTADSRSGAAALSSSGGGGRAATHLRGSFLRAVPVVPPASAAAGPGHGPQAAGLALVAAPTEAAAAGRAVGRLCCKVQAPPNHGR